MVSRVGRGWYWKEKGEAFNRRRGANTGAGVSTCAFSTASAMDFPRYSISSSVPSLKSPSVSNTAGFTSPQAPCKNRQVGAGVSRGSVGSKKYCRQIGIDGGVRIGGHYDLAVDFFFDYKRSSRRCVAH
jgi:hypothetical protein